MNTDLKRFSTRLLIAALFAALVTLLINNFLPPSAYTTPAWPYLLCFFSRKYFSLCTIRTC